MCSIHFILLGIIIIASTQKNNIKEYKILINATFSIFTDKIFYSL